MSYTIIGLILISFLLAPVPVVHSPHIEWDRALETAYREGGNETTYTVWIYVSDKGSHLNERLAELGKTLLPRNIRRRNRNRMIPLCDIHDLPVNAEYIRRIRGRVQRIRHVSRWLNAISCEISGEQLNRLSAMPWIKRVGLVQSFRKPGSISRFPEQFVDTWSMSRSPCHTLDYGPSFHQSHMINVPAVHDLNFTGESIRICILDGGFNNDSHEAFQHLNVIDRKDFLYGDDDVGDEPGDEGNSDHGTWVLGIVGGYAPGDLIGPAYNAEYLLAKTECSSWDSHIEEDNWIAGAEWADSLGADIISSSLGYRAWFLPGEYQYDWEDMDGNTAISTIGADIAASRGILVVNAVGNLGPSNPPDNTLCAPSDGDSVLAVGGVLPSGAYGNFSGMGPTADGRIKPDVMALGSGVYTVSASGEGYSFVPEPGTSWCAPQIAGAAALILQANPRITNMEIIDALRHTSSQADTPDNARGWGIVNCLEALLFFKPRISHTPIPDTEDLLGPYAIEAEIVSEWYPLLEDSLFVYHRISGDQWSAAYMNSTSPGVFRAEIDGSGIETDIQYYISAYNEEYGMTAPWGAPEAHYSFHAGVDRIPPVIHHSPIDSVMYPGWPPTITAKVSDNMAVDEDNVYVEWEWNDSNMDPFFLESLGDSLFSGIFPVVDVRNGDRIEYRIGATDVAGIPNTGYHPASGLHEIQITDPRGMILIVWDMHRDMASECMTYHSWLEASGYYVRIDTMDTTDPASWTQFDLLAAMSGGNSDPVSSSEYREHLIEFVQKGGLLFIEGGDIGKVMQTTDPEFVNRVLRSSSWSRDFAGALRKVSEYAGHPLLNDPHELPYQIALSNDGSTSIHDAMVPVDEAYVVYNPTASPGHTGVLISDTVEGKPHSVYFSFNLGGIADTTVAQHLLENTVAYLLGESSSAEPPGVSPVAEYVRIEPVHPHPIRNTAEITYVLDRPSAVRLRVYNIRGECIETLVDEPRMSAGHHKIQWEARTHASGVYVIRLSSRRSCAVRKALILR